jgi:hypothetical protein
MPSCNVYQMLLHAGSFTAIWGNSEYVEFTFRAIPNVTSPLGPDEPDFE